LCAWKFEAEAKEGRRLNFISNQLNRIGQQLNGLSASQKMLAGALVLVMVLTLMLWGRYAGTSEMVPVFDQSLSSDEIGRIQGFLRGQGMTSTVSSDNRVMVPSARQAEALAILTYNRMQPRDTSASFDRITAQMSPFNSSSQNIILAGCGRCGGDGGRA
jgi:flagellar biosynthesis/type III secretory pathway M-ring protein FliF/YscJ